MAAAETAQSYSSAPPNLSTTTHLLFSGDGQKIQREEFRKEWKIVWVSGNAQQWAQEKINPKHQTMSEWIIREPRHRAMEWEEGKVEGAVEDRNGKT